MFRYIWEGARIERAARSTSLVPLLTTEIGLIGQDLPSTKANWQHFLEAWSLSSSLLQKLPETGQHMFQPIVTGVTVWAQPVCICH